MWQIPLSGYEVACLLQGLSGLVGQKGVVQSKRNGRIGALKQGCVVNLRALRINSFSAGKQHLGTQAHSVLEVQVTQEVGIEPLYRRVQGRQARISVAVTAGRKCGLVIGAGVIGAQIAICIKLKRGTVMTDKK